MPPSLPPDRLQQLAKPAKNGDAIGMGSGRTIPIKQVTNQGQGHFVTGSLVSKVGRTNCAYFSGRAWESNISL